MVNFYIFKIIYMLNKLLDVELNFCADDDGASKEDISLMQRGLIICKVGGLVQVVRDPTSVKLTTRQNPPILSPPPYISVTNEPIMIV